MSRILTWSIGLLLAGISCSALAEPARQSGQAVPAGPNGAPAVSRSTAAALAKAVAPMDILIPAELEQARKAILALPTLDEDAKQLEQEFPGIYAAIWAASEAEMKRQTEAGYPGFLAMLEQLYLARLTEREAQGVLTFFQSPTGQKLLRNVYGSFDAAPLVAEMAKSGSSIIDARQMQAATDAVKAKVVRQMGPEDEDSLLALSKAMELKKFREISAETQKISLEWVNRADPEGEERLGKIMEQATERYIKAHSTQQ